MVLTMYYACAHSYYLQDDGDIRLGPWCLLFEYKDFKVNYLIYTKKMYYTLYVKKKYGLII